MYEFAPYTWPSVFLRMVAQVAAREENPQQSCHCALAWKQAQCPCTQALVGPPSLAAHEPDLHGLKICHPTVLSNGRRAAETPALVSKGMATVDRSGFTHSHGKIKFLPILDQDGPMTLATWKSQLTVSTGNPPLKTLHVGKKTSLLPRYSDQGCPVFGSS